MVTSLLADESTNNSELERDGNVVDKPSGGEVKSNSMRDKIDAIVTNNLPDQDTSPESPNWGFYVSLSPQHEFFPSSKTSSGTRESVVEALNS